MEKNYSNADFDFDISGIISEKAIAVFNKGWSALGQDGNEDGAGMIATFLIGAPIAIALAILCVL